MYSSKQSFFKMGYEHAELFPLVEPVIIKAELRNRIATLPDTRAQAEYLLGFREGQLTKFFNSVLAKVNLWSVDKSPEQLGDMLNAIYEAVERKING